MVLDRTRHPVWGIVYHLDNCGVIGYINISKIKYMKNKPHFLHVKTMIIRPRLLLL